MSEAQTHEPLYHVVVNHEEQYSIWPDGRAVPAGWTLVGEARAREACLEHIKTVWVDMRPLSLRRQMDAVDATRQAVL